MHTLSSILQVFCKSWLRMVHRGFLSTTEIESSFFFQFPPAWRVIINEKNGRSLFLSLPLLHFRFGSRDRDARCSDAYRLPLPLLVSLHLFLISVYPNDLPLFAEGVVSFARGEKGRSSSLFHPFVPDEKIRTKHRALLSASVA